MSSLAPIIFSLVSFVVLLSRSKGAPCSPRPPLCLTRVLLPSTYPRVCVEPGHSGLLFRLPTEEVLGYFRVHTGADSMQHGHLATRQGLRIFECPTGSIGTGVDRGQAPNWCARPTSRTSMEKQKNGHSYMYDLSKYMEYFDTFLLLGARVFHQHDKPALQPLSRVTPKVCTHTSQHPLSTVGAGGATTHKSSLFVVVQRVKPI